MKLHETWYETFTSTDIAYLDPFEISKLPADRFAESISIVENEITQNGWTFHNAIVLFELKYIHKQFEMEYPRPARLWSVYESLELISVYEEREVTEAERLDMGYFRYWLVEEMDSATKGYLSELYFTVGKGVFLYYLTKEQLKEAIIELDHEQIERIAKELEMRIEHHGPIPYLTDLYDLLIN